MSYVTKEEFAAAIKIYEKEMYSLALYYMKNEENALDAVHEAVLKAFEKRASLKDKAKFKQWIMGITRNTCKTMLKKQKKIVLVEDVWKEEQVTEKPDELWNLVKELEPEFQEVIRLYYYEGFSTKEISRILRISEGTVKSRLARARGKIKAILQR